MEEIKITGQVGGKVNDEDLEIRFKTLLRQMREARGLNTFSDQLKAIMDEVDKSTLASELSYGSQLTELNQLTARVSEIFVGLAKQNETDRIFRERQYEEVLEKKDLEITNLKEQLEDIKGKLELREKDYLEIEEGYKKKEEELVNVKGRVEDQAKMVQFQDDQLKVKDQTIANQAQKIDSMSLEVSQNEELKLSITHLQEEINNLNKKHTKDKQQSEFDFERRLFSKERELQQSFQE
jgi:chromosome segregation ATPase